MYPYAYEPLVVAEMGFPVLVWWGMRRDVMPLQQQQQQQLWGVLGLHIVLQQVAANYVQIILLLQLTVLLVGWSWQP
jgi:hypothetical protein